MIRIECKLCERYGEYREDKFFRIAGTTNRADARIAFAIARGCKRAINQDAQQIHDRCEIGYVVGERTENER